MRGMQPPTLLAMLLLRTTATAAVMAAARSLTWPAQATSFSSCCGVTSSCCVDGPHAGQLRLPSAMSHSMCRTGSMQMSLLSSAATAALTSPTSSTFQSPELASPEDQDDGSASKKKSVLVAGWFHASQRELDYVRRMYVKQGYEDVLVEPTVVGTIAKPRGWYRTLRRSLRPQSSRSATPPPPRPAHALARHFDLVHCLSGGFLSLYVLLRSGVPLSFSTLLLDSTPILPKPTAFTRFARAYLSALGWNIPLAVFPQKLHLFLVQTRWRLGLWYILARHRILQRLGRLQGEALEAWTGGPVSWALRGDWERVSDHALGTVLQGASAADSNVIFLYNPDDPYIDTRDVERAALISSAAGLNVRKVHQDCDHVQALFSAPRAVFRLLPSIGEKTDADADADAEAEAGAGAARADAAGHTDAHASAHGDARGDLYDSGRHSTRKAAVFNAVLQELVEGGGDVSSARLSDAMETQIIPEPLLQGKETRRKSKARAN